MGAKINTGQSISKTINYNEQKAKQERAELLEAVNFLNDADDLNVNGFPKQDNIKLGIELIGFSPILIW